jgi:hypothetical protein
MPGNSCAFGVGFDPTSGGTKSAAISFTDDAQLSPQQVDLIGFGVAPAAPPATTTPTTTPPPTTPTPTKKKCKKRKKSAAAAKKKCKKRKK